LKFNTKLPDDEVNVTKSSALGDLTWMLAGVSAFILLIYFSLGFAIEYGVKKISVENEQKLFAFVQADKFIEKVQNKNEKHLQTLVDSSKTCSQTQYNFVVNISDSNESNAFAIPGGLIVVTQGLLDKAKSENELFFVLAHEIGHFQNRDHLEGIGRSFVALTLSSMLGLSEASDLLEASLNFSESQFSQDTESDADLYAVNMMQCYYGHVNGATDFFNTLPKDKNYDLFASHPKTLHRIELIEAHIKSKGYSKEGLKEL